MKPEATLQTFQFNAYHVQAYVPDALPLQQWFTANQKLNPSFPSPYWAQVWPAARALCRFIAEQPHWIKDKQILELAAGLGLPSLLAAGFAKEVTCSDYIADAVDMMQCSVKHNDLQNTKSILLNWNELPPDIKTDVLLLSDINYEPSAFEILLKVMKQFLANGTVILLSTPQRLMAKPFIEQILPYCIQQNEIPVKETKPETICTVMILQK